MDKIINGTYVPFIFGGKEMKKALFGQIMLVLAALIWGSSFIVMKDVVDFLTPAVLLFVRFSLATVFMFVLFFKYLKKLTKKDMAAGAITGGCLFTAYYVQTVGLTMTTPSKNAFLTAVYCAIVPFLVWVIYHKKPDTYHFVAAILCFVGIGCVSLTGNLSFQMGDILTLVGGFFYAFHILAVKKYSEDIHPIRLTTLQFAFCAIYALVVSLFREDVTSIALIESTMLLQIFYLAFFATTLALLFQNVGQQLTSACSASIILSLESVFGVIFSVLLYGEVLTIKVSIGFALIFIAIIIAETKLSFLKKKEVRYD